MFSLFFNYWQILRLATAHINLKGTSSNSHHVLVCDIKSNPGATLIYNDIKSDICLSMICKSMFITPNESFKLLQEFVLASKKQHGVKVFDLTLATVRMVCMSYSSTGYALLTS